MPMFSIQVPAIFNLTVHGKMKVSGITWQASLDVRSMSCRNSGVFLCIPYNPLGNKAIATVTLEVSGL